MHRVRLTADDVSLQAREQMGWALSVLPGEKQTRQTTLQHAPHIVNDISIQDGYGLLTTNVL